MWLYQGKEIDDNVIDDLVRSVAKKHRIAHTALEKIFSQLLYKKREIFLLFLLNSCFSFR